MSVNASSGCSESRWLLLVCRSHTNRQFLELRRCGWTRRRRSTTLSILGMSTVCFAADSGPRSPATRSRNSSATRSGCSQSHWCFRSSVRNLSNSSYRFRHAANCFADNLSHRGRPEPPSGEQSRRRTRDGRAQGALASSLSWPWLFWCVALLYR